jgi:hypothetical protein
LGISSSTATAANYWEVGMRKARQILDSENKMLEQLITVINSFATPENYPDELERNNLKCWGKELSAYRDVNVKYQAMTDDDLSAALKAESAILQRCLDAVQSDSDAGKMWKEYFEGNIWYTDKAHDRV